MLSYFLLYLLVVAVLVGIAVAVPRSRVATIPLAALMLLAPFALVALFFLAMGTTHF